MSREWASELSRARDLWAGDWDQKSLLQPWSGALHTVEQVVYCTTLKGATHVTLVIDL